jgi:hypothetical protein
MEMEINNNKSRPQNNNKSQPQKNVDFFAKKYKNGVAPVLGEVEPGTFGL